MAHDERARAAVQEPPITEADLEDQLVAAKEHLRTAANQLGWVLAELQGTRYRDRDGQPDPEVLAGALETLASLATTMAAEARTGKVAW